MKLLREIVSIAVPFPRNLHRMLHCMVARIGAASDRTDSAQAPQRAAGSVMMHARGFREHRLRMGKGGKRLTPRG